MNPPQDWNEMQRRQHVKPVVRGSRWASGAYTFVETAEQTTLIMAVEGCGALRLTCEGPTFVGLALDTVVPRYRIE